MRTEHPSADGPESLDASSFEEAVAAYVDRLLAGERLDPLEVLLAHPGTGHQVLERLESFIFAGEDSPPPLRRLGDFTLLRELGRGGMGVVYEARQESMDRRVALKVLPAGVAADRAAFLRFLREAHTAGKLQHPSIVSVFSLGVEAETPFYAMEYIEGETLAEVVAKRRAGSASWASGVFGVPEVDVAYFAGVAKAFAEVAEGLHHAHREGVVHRDIKPSNVIVDATGRLRILDFGLAYLEDLGTLTLTGEVLGTPLYMSPEQARREAIPVDHRTDVYSLGATLYEVLTLDPPFRGRDRHDTLRQIIEHDPPTLRSRESRVPVELETVVLHCLRKDPERRYGTAQALAQDLGRFAMGEPVEARPEAAWERLRRRLRRNRVRLGVSLGFCLLLALAAFLAYRGERAAQEMARERYGPAVLELAARLVAGEFSLQASAASRAQAVQLFGGPFAPFSSVELRLLLQGGALQSVREAAEDLRRLTEELPGVRDGHYYLSRAHRLLGRDDLAREAAQRALAIDPGFVPAAEVLREINGEPIGQATKPVESLAEGKSPIRKEWDTLWLKARRAIRQEYLWVPTDRQGALEAFDGLVRIAQAYGEPYAGLLLEAHLGRGVARLGLGDLDGACEDFVLARYLAPTSLEPVLLLANAYRQGKKPDRADSILEALYREMPPDRRDETALWIALVHALLSENNTARAWAGRLSSVGPRARLKTILSLRLGDWDSAVTAAREAVALAPDDRTCRLLLASVLLLRVSRGEDSGCEERIEMLEELKNLTESEPADRHAAFLLRMALETARPHLRLTSRSSAMGKTTDCSAILVALALALGATPPATADRVILDDFVVDPDFADGEPLTWIADANSRCVAIVHEELGEGLRVEAAGTECAGVLMTSEVFSGDVTIRTQSSVGRQSEAFLHLNLFAATGYSVNVCARNCWDGRQYIVGLVRWDGWDRAPLRLDQSPGFDPNEGDVNLELSSRGEFVECRVWPEGAARPDEPLYRIHDEAYRSGAVAFSADPSFDARPAPALLRWAEITVASPEPEPFLFRRGDSNDDGKVDISDGIHLLGFLFLGGVAPSCNDAADADDSGVLGLTDAVFLFDFLFRGADPPPSPGPSECAQDPTKDDGLECAGAVCP